jgi:large subunit ribosomal protein L18
MRVQFKRRRENKTDYLKREKLLRGNIPRLVFRKSNKYIQVQYVESKSAQDKVIFNLTTKMLLEKSFPKEFSGSLKSIPASYLIGYYAGKKIQKEKLKQPIIDTGMYPTLYKTKIFAFIQGVIDSGIKISCKKEAFPSKESIEGKNLKQDFSSHFNKVKQELDKI